jgi:stage II sporulation protein D (peptidoglycan lytic transglycosylase)
VIRSRLRSVARTRRGRRVSRKTSTVRIRVRRGAVIERWPLERYVTGVLVAEAPVGAPPAMLEALAVVCRSFALRAVVFRRSRRYDVVDSRLDQMFAPPELADTNVADAVARTTGAYLLDGAERRSTMALRALFHTSCGGATDDPDAVWGRGAERIVAMCPGCSARSVQWDHVVDPGSVRAFLGVPAAKGFSVEVVERTPVGRARMVRLTSGGDVRQLRGEDFRRALGYDNVLSSWFDATPQPNGVIRLDGRGIGHGVGLCVAGAVVLAREGATSERILERYFPDSARSTGTKRRSRVTRSSSIPVSSTRYR